MEVSQSCHFAVRVWLALLALPAVLSTMGAWWRLVCGALCQGFWPRPFGQTGIGSHLSRSADRTLVALLFHPPSMAAHASATTLKASGAKLVMLTERCTPAGLTLGVVAAVSAQRLSATLWAHVLRAAVFTLLSLTLYLGSDVALEAGFQAATEPIDLEAVSEEALVAP